MADTKKHEEKKHEEKKRYLVGPAGGYIHGRMYGEGQIVECLPSERSKTWREVDAEGKPVEERTNVDQATDVIAADKEGVAHTHDEGDPKTLFGAQKPAAKRRGEE